MMSDVLLPIVTSWGHGIGGLWAYLDPGSGSLALQILLAGLLSAGFCLRSWIRQLKDVFSSKN